MPVSVPIDTLPPEAFLARFPEAMRDIAERLRRVVLSTVPDAVERVRPGWRLVGYDAPVDGRRPVYFCYVAPEPGHVHLGFEYGVLMTDEDGMLEGAGVTRQVRWLTFRDVASIDEAMVRRLVLEGARVARLPAAERFGRLADAR